MANVTDPLIKSVQGSDPQNLMEYITRQKIYDSRFWKEECFGLTAADVMERAAKSLTCVGGTFSGMGKPTKFLSLTLKLLQLQPDISVIETFLKQNHFKYLKVLGAFYLRLTGRPQEIYEMLDPLYADYSKLKYRDVNEWKLIYVDEFIDDLLTKPICCGIAMPRLPVRETLQEAGYLDEGPRLTALHDALMKAGGIKEYLKIKVDQEIQEHMVRSTDESNLTHHDGRNDSNSAVSLWESRYGKVKMAKKENHARDSNEKSDEAIDAIVIEGGKGGATSLDLSSAMNNNNASIDEPHNRTPNSTEERERKRKSKNTLNREKKKAKRNKEKKHASKYGTLFKASAIKRSKDKSSKYSEDEIPSEKERQGSNTVDQSSEEYWNNLRSTLGMNPLKK